MDIDFGYELVDKIWVLDIPTEQSAPSPSKLVSMIKPMQIPKPIPAPGNILGGLNNGNGNIPQQNNDSIKNGVYQNGNERRNGSTGNAKSISYGATAQNIRPITALPGFPGAGRQPGERAAAAGESGSAGSTRPRSSRGSRQWLRKSSDFGARPDGG